MRRGEVVVERQHYKNLSVPEGRMGPLMSRNSIRSGEGSECGLLQCVLGAGGSAGPGHLLCAQAREPGCRGGSSLLGAR
jgi:hypothetical protein